MREAAIATLNYQPEAEGNLFIFVERITKRDGSRTVTMTAERFSDCHDEMVGENTSIGVCDQEWKEEMRITDSAFDVTADLESARLETNLRGRKLSVRWRPDSSCEPGGTTVKMGMRHASAAGRWGDDSFPWDDSGSISRRVKPDAANRFGSCKFSS